MSAIEDRIVNMRFNGDQFSAGIKGAQIALGLLKKSLNLDGATKSLENLDAKGKSFSLAGLSKGVEAIGSKFSAMSIVGITALTNIANKAINAGETILKSLTIDPIMDGFREYELKMGSIQTILANTSRHGTGLAEVTSNLEELNLYADKTIYNFGDMTRNIGLFTNAGIKIGDATSMIKGFSNEAAASGTTAQGASGAAYQLSQALSAGTIRLMDWKSLSNVGMGNKNMQNGLIELAQAMGTFEGKSITAEQAAADFNGSLEKEWLSADVMQNYLQIQAGDLSDAQMETIGLTGEQITAFKKQQTIAEEAATKVRTWTQLLGTLQEGVGSGWGQTFETLIGDFDQATDLFTAVNDTLGPMIAASGDARNKMLDEWAKLGGRENLISGLSKAFTVLMAIINPIIDAFKEIFPPMTGERLFAITSALNKFMDELYLSESLIANVKSTFKGLFAVLDIGWMIIKGVVGVIFDLIGSLGGAGGGVLAFTGGIGNFLVAVRDALKNGEGLNAFFKGLTAVLKVPLGIISFLVSGFVALASSIGGLNKGDSASAIEGFKTRLDPLKRLGKALSDIWSGFVDVVMKVVDFFAPLGGIISNVVKTVGDAIRGAVEGMDFNGVLDLLNVGLIAGAVLGIKKIIGIFSDGGGIGGGFLDTIKDAFGGLTDTLGAMQAQLKSKVLINIALAVALLTASILVLSFIDSARLTAALVAITLMFTQLAVAMGVFSKMASGPGIVQIPILAAGLILLAAAILILTASVAILATMDWDELAKGLLGVAVLIKLLVEAAKGLRGIGPGMISTGIGLMTLAIAIGLLAISVKMLSTMSWEELSKGLLGVGALLGSLALFTKISKVSKGSIAQAAGIILLAIALRMLVDVVKQFGSMDLMTLGVGIGGVAASLALIGLAMKLMPTNMLLSAAGLYVIGMALQQIQPVLAAFGNMSWEAIGKAAVMLAGSLGIIAGAMYLMTGAIPGALALIVVANALATMAPALESFGAMSWEAIGKAAVVLAGSLLIIAGGMYLMSAALPGAAAMIIVAQALSILAPVLTTLGGMSWDEIVHGLVALAGVFAVIGLAGLLLTPLVPTLLGLGVAIMLIGAGTALAGAGILALSVGIAALAVSGAAGAAALVAVVTAILGMVPMILTVLGESLITIATIIGETAPAIVAALVVLITAILNAIIELTPVIGEAFIALVTMLLTAIVDLAPKIGEALLALLQMLIDIVTTAIPQLVAVAVLLITSILDALGVVVPQAVALLTSIVSKFLESITTLTPQIIGVFVALISALLQAIITLTPQIIQVFVTLIMSLLNAARTLIPEYIRTFTEIIMALLNAINTLAPAIVQTLVNLLHLLVETVVSQVPYMVNAGLRLLTGILNGIANNIGKMVTAGVNIVVNFLNGISQNLPRVIEAGINLIVTFVESLATGINNNTGRMQAAGKDLAWAIINGMTGGLLEGVGNVIAKAAEVGNRAISAIRNAIDSHSPSKKSAELGRFTSDGLALGMIQNASKVEKAGTGLGNSALDAIKTGIDKAAALIDGGMDMTPVIRPVLDLSDIRNNAGLVDSMFGNPSLALTGSYNSAASISNGNRAVRDVVVPTNSSEATQAVGNTTIFNQVNNSPKALSSADIYRQTKNQLSVTKGVVTK